MVTQIQNGGGHI